MIFFFIFTKLYAQRNQFIPNDTTLSWIAELNVDRIILPGMIMVGSGFLSAVSAFYFWVKTGFGEMNPEDLMRFLLPVATLIEIGVELIFSGFFIGILNIKWKDYK